VRFLLDESADMRIAPYLWELGHDVTGIVTDYPARLPDDEVLAIAFREGRTLITHDLDYGELVFVKHQPHAGVILIRLGPSPPLEVMISRLEEVFSQHSQDLGQFIVVSHHLIRVRGEHSPRPEGRHDRAGHHHGDSQ
jgi:predicted nuclease of predicted toxin-antitoxin system